MQQLQGLENVLKIASRHMELKFDKWKDVNVTSWQREECVKRRLQTDGYNYIQFGEFCMLLFLLQDDIYLQLYNCNFYLSN
jgi:hypothetical protein